MTPLQTALQTALAENRLTHGAWTRTDADGRQLLCLLAAMSPEVAAAKNAAACPSSVAPLWLAHLLPWMDDAPSSAYRPEVWRRVANLQDQWVERWPQGWPADVSRRADLRCRRVAVMEARSRVEAYETEVLAAIDAVVGLLDRASDGDEPSEKEWDEEWASAERASPAAWPVARMALRAARAATAAWVAAEMRAETALRAARAARAAAGGDAAMEGASDRMIAAMLDIIEAEIAAGEAS